VKNAAHASAANDAERQAFRLASSPARRLLEIAAVVVPETDASFTQEGDTRVYLSERHSKARLKEAENARRNRAEILRALSWG
jgi:hypothetical protein